MNCEPTSIYDDFKIKNVVIKSITPSLVKINNQNDDSLTFKINFMTENGVHKCLEWSCCINPNCCECISVKLILCDTQNYDVIHDNDKYNTVHTGMGQFVESYNERETVETLNKLLNFVNNEKITISLDVYKNNVKIRSEEEGTEMDDDIDDAVSIYSDLIIKSVSNSQVIRYFNNKGNFYPHELNLKVFNEENILEHHIKTYI